MKDFHLPMHSRSVFSRIGVVPAHGDNGGRPQPADKSLGIRARKRSDSGRDSRDSPFWLFKVSLQPCSAPGPEAFGAEPFYRPSLPNAECFVKLQD